MSGAARQTYRYNTRQLGVPHGRECDDFARYAWQL